MIGGVVLAPTAAFAQDRDRDGSRNQSWRSSGNRRNDNLTQRRQRSQSSQWNQRSDSRWNDSRDGDRDGSPWWQSNRNHNDDQWRNRDRDDRNSDWDRNRDRNWRDPDHDGDVDTRRHRTVTRYYNYYPDTYYSPSYDYGYRNYGYDNSYGYDNGYGYNRADDWRNIADAAGLLAVIGALNHDDTLVFVGTFGALYSLDRYNHDRYSSDPCDRLRAEYFSRSCFYRDGRRYERETVNRDGCRYYRFVCR